MITGTLSSTERLFARSATEAPRIPWDDFLSHRFDWQRGEHVACIGPTGQGKTTLVKAILPQHPYVVIFATKPRDESLEQFEHLGYTRIDRWRSMDPRVMPRRLLWPDARRLSSAPHQTEVFRDAMDKIYLEGYWTIMVDELMYFVNRLKLRTEIVDFYTQGRSSYLSLVAGTQRPAWVPGEMYDQSTHLFLWRNNDLRAQRRLSEINHVDSDLVRHIVARLETHQVLYINARTGEMCRTRVNLRSVGGEGNSR